MSAQSRKPRIRRLIVSLHDVAPPFEHEIRSQLEALAAVGVHRCVLKVVPNWHGDHPLSSAPSLVELLQERCETGSELVLHGLEHRRQGPLRGPVHDRLRASLFAGDAAEFLTLAPDDALRSVRQGRELFAAAGLPAPTSFCAPGWLLAPDLRSALAEAGIRRVIGMFTVYDLETGCRRILPALGSMGAAPLHEAAIQLGNRIVRLAGLRADIEKVYLHPQGGTERPDVRRVLSQAQRMIAQGWQPATYRELW